MKFALWYLRCLSCGKWVGYNFQDWKVTYRSNKGSFARCYISACTDCKIRSKLELLRRIL
jgi:hypothetical protein